MSINNNIWELAEAYLTGSLPDSEVIELKSRLETDAAFANEFYEMTNLIRSFEGSGKQKRFRTMLRDIHETEVEGTGSKKTRYIIFTPQFWRTAAVAAGVAILTSTITIWSLNPSIKKHDSQYNTISREVGVIKKVQAQQQAEQDKLKEIVSKSNKPSPPPSDVKYTGTGFALTNDGYFVTANHVIHHDGKGDFDSVYIQNHDGQYFKAQLIHSDPKKDIAILKVEKKNFHFGKGELPYTFVVSKTCLGSKIFTLGYPQDDEVYSEGYISCKNGYEGDALQYTLDLPVRHGQSGSPLLDEKGNVVGILAAIGSLDEANTYAVSSKALIELLHDQMPDDKTVRLPKVNKLGRLNREEQIAKMGPYTFSVKVYKK
jgi:serine protease Do